MAEPIKLDVCEIKPRSTKDAQFVAPVITINGYPTYIILEELFLTGDKVADAEQALSLLDRNLGMGDISAMHRFGGFYFNGSFVQVKDLKVVHPPIAI